MFPPFRVDVTATKDVEAVGSSNGEDEERVDVWQTFRGNEWDNKGERRGGNAVEVVPVAKKEFYQDRGGCEFSLLFSAFRDGNMFGSPTMAVGIGKANVLIERNSQRVGIPQESYDPDGSLLWGTNLWNALSDGEQ